MRWVRRLFHKSSTESDLDKELRFHLERQIADYVTAGINPEEARRRARLEFGGIEQVKEEVRDTRWETHFDTLFRDFRYAFRSLRKDRRFVLTTILALGLGIGATTAMFSLVYNLLIDPLPYKDGNRLTVVKIHDMKESGNRDRESFSIPEFIDCRTQNHVFEDVIGSYNLDVLYDDGKGLRKTGGAFVTTNTFEFLRVPPLLGRGLTQGDGNPGAPPVFVMNYRLWQGEFSGDPAIVGKTLRASRPPIHGHFLPSLCLSCWWASLPACFQPAAPPQSIHLLPSATSDAPGEAAALAARPSNPALSLGCLASDSKTAPLSKFRCVP